MQFPCRGPSDSEASVAMEASIGWKFHAGGGLFFHGPGCHKYIQIRRTRTKAPVSILWGVYKNIFIHMFCIILLLCIYIYLHPQEPLKTKVLLNTRCFSGKLDVLFFLGFHVFIQSTADHFYIKHFPGNVIECLLAPTWVSFKTMQCMPKRKITI